MRLRGLLRLLALVVLPAAWIATGPVAADRPAWPSADFMPPLDHLGFQQPLVQTPTSTPVTVPGFDLTSFDPPPGTVHPRLESALSRAVVDEAAARDIRRLARWRGAPSQPDTLSVIIETESGATQSVAAAVAGRGLPVQASYRNLLQVQAPPSALVALAQLPEVRFVRRPVDLFAQAVESQGVGLSMARSWHQGGFRGQGARVAVVDQGFVGYRARLGTELPAVVRTRSFNAEEPDIGSSSEHGTAVAEIVYDMAPDADLYLVTVTTEVELGNAVQWLVEEGVHVISFSLGALAAPNDGSGMLDDIVDSARAAGVLWVSAAGNYGRSHWQGGFSDQNGDGWHEFESGTQLLAFEMGINEVGVFVLSWDGWPSTFLDYGFYLFWEGVDGHLQLMGFSDSAQAGVQPPVESIVTFFSPRGRYYLAIKQHAATRPARFHVYSLVHEFPTGRPESSVISPATARGALAVGATNGFDQLQPYSSRGPTGDGRVKPDLVAPDSVNTSTYGESGFPGTSSSTPHVAGAAALLLSAYPSWKAEDLQRFLEAEALHVLTAEKNNVYGSGRVRLGPTPSVAPAAATATPLPTAKASPSATSSPVSQPTATTTGTPAPTRTPTPPGPTPTGVVWPEYFRYLPVGR